MGAISVPILGFHQLSAPPPVGGEHRSAEPAEIFERYIRHLHFDGYNCISLSELSHYARYGRLFWKRTVVLTFDDGYEDFLTLAHPVLSHYGFSATVFVVTDLVGARSNWQGETGSPLLSWEQIKLLQKAGVTFGSHTCSHPRLTSISEQQLWHELADSKKCLEDRLSEEVGYLAYPHGESNTRIQQVALEAGYDMACGLQQGMNYRYNVPRRPCGLDDSLETLIYKSSREYELRRWFRVDTRLGQFLHKVRHA